MDKKYPNIQADSMKALFFLRHYNDIDHIVPVIYKWLECGHHGDIILLGNKIFAHDYRIEFLRGYENIRVCHISELMPWSQWLSWRLHMRLLNSRLQRSIIGPLINTAASLLGGKRRTIVWQETSQRLLDWGFSGHDKGVVVFDWITRFSPVSLEWVQTVVSTAHTMRLGAVSLPHGDSPHISHLIRRGEWRLKEANPMYAAGCLFDQLVVPNELCARRFRPFMENQQLAVLGSPRYCDEWLAQLAAIRLPAPPVLNQGLLNIVVFLRKSEFTIFWEEVSEVVRMLAAMPGIEVVIKPHTRGGWRQWLTKDISLRRLTNVTVAGGEIHSMHLINWGHVMIDLATSVVFEAVKANKPVLAADYLHAGCSTIAAYMPETELRCRDDVYNHINKFLNEGCQNFYISEHRQRFIKEMIDGSESQNVLGRYVALLQQQSQK